MILYSGGQKKASGGKRPRTDRSLFTIVHDVVTLRRRRRRRRRCRHFSRRHERTEVLLLCVLLEDERDAGLFPPLDVGGQGGFAQGGVRTRPLKGRVARQAAQAYGKSIYFNHSEQSGAIWEG